MISWTNITRLAGGSFALALLGFGVWYYFFVYTPLKYSEEFSTIFHEFEKNFYEKNNITPPREMLN